jgi:large subunit ribosomal protein L4
LSRLELKDGVLIVIADADQAVERAARNLPHVKVLRCVGLNVYDLLRYQHCLFTQAALERVSQRLTT